MKNLLIFGFVILLASCSKNSIDKQASSLQEKEKQTCDFGIKSFTLTKREPVNLENGMISDKRPPGGGGAPPPPPPAGTGVLLLDFDGQFVSGTSWNYGGDFTCAPANLTADQINQIVQRVTNDYSPFNVVVTTDEAVFNATSYKRMRAIITESWEWFGQAGGTSFQNTFTAGSTTPCFVFSSLLNYNTKQIGEAASHETGHTLNLRHQSVYGANGVKISEYNSGQGAGEIGWAPIMGNSYSQNLTLWHYGPNSVGASSIQDDAAIIATALGYRTDDYSNTVSSAAALSASLNGIINNSSDLDFFSVNLGATTTVTLTPFNVGVNNEGSDVDLVLRIYNSQGTLISATNNVNTLNAVTVLGAGNYYISAGTVSNLYTTTYGMIGKYNISLN